jgi:hypothetical protein
MHVRAQLGGVLDDQIDPVGDQIGGDDRCTGGRHAGRLAAGGGAHVDDELTREGADRIGHPGRRPVLGVAVGSHGGRHRPVHRLQSLLGHIATEVGFKSFDDPVRIGQLLAQAAPPGRAGAHHVAQHGVDQAPPPLGHGANGRVERGVVGKPHLKLVDAQAQSPHRHVGGSAVEERVDDRVEAPSLPHGAVGQLGDQAPIGVAQVAAVEGPGHDQVGPRAVILDAGEQLERQATGGHAR